MLKTPVVDTVSLNNLLMIASDLSFEIISLIMPL